MFMKEMRVVLWMFFELKEISAGCLDEAKKKDIFGLAIVRRLEQFGADSYDSHKRLAGLLSHVFAVEETVNPGIAGKSVLTLFF